MGKPVGIRGSWFANWEGHPLPCVHQHWCKFEGGRMRYHDPYITNSEKWAPFVEAVERERRVILTKDEVGPGDIPSFSREGYVALFRVEDVQMRDGALSFDFVERLADFT